LLKHHFVLAAPFEPTGSESLERFSAGLQLASERSLAITGRPDAFTVIFSGHAARRTLGWHLHVVVLPGRFEKAWFYFVLCGKNILQAIHLRRDRFTRSTIDRDGPASGGSSH